MSDEDDQENEDSQELFLTDDAIFALVSTLTTEVIRYGEIEAELIHSKHLSDDQIIAVMKSNTLLTVFAMLLVRVVESKDLNAATAIVNCWISPAVQDMVQIAFAEEIEEAATMVTDGIDNLEASLGKETNDTPSEPGD